MQFRKTTLFAAVAASLVAIGAPQGAQAQEPQPPTQPPTEPTTPQPPTSLPTQPPTDTAQQPTPPSAAQSSAAEVITALSRIDAQIQALQSATVGNVRVVNVNNAVQGAGAEQLSSAIELNQAGIQKLRAAVDSNEAVRTALSQSNVSVDNVVAIDVQSSGDVVVYYKPE
ncbi:MAG TPA: hypothetical protein VFS08_11740 [Gemmatimonadaceae bacterium]|nr:hypothetical protein [Gemmatimonadaceae bacterium]